MLADGMHGLPKLLKEMINEVTLEDRTKLWRGERALPVCDVKQSSIRKIDRDPGHHLCLSKSEGGPIR